jgi:hypothetical protein
MRFIVSAATLALLAGPALAQTTPAPATTATPAPSAAPAVASPAPAAAATAPPAAAPTAPKKMVGHRQTLPQHFAAANTLHDGHLTKDQATAAKWSYVARHFDAMDTDKKGFVTVNDIRAYAAAHRAVHKKVVPAAPAAAPATNS